MWKPSKKTKRLYTTFFGILFVVFGTYFAIQFAKGYRPTRTGIQGTGLLAANSFPPGAEVYLDNRLTTATDDTLNLPPGEYEVTIKKDGYLPWFKRLTIKAELVTQTNATLFKAVPSLTPLTLSGAGNVTPSPDGQKIAYAVTSASANARNGLYVLQLNSSPMSLQNRPKQVARNTANYDFSAADLLWSPDSTQILAHFTETTRESSNYLISADSLNDMEKLPDVTARLSVIFSEWEEDISLRETKQFMLLPDNLREIATASAVNVYFSPNEQRVLYTSTGYATLAANLIKTPPATSTQPEEREIKPGYIYVYDLIEDKNFNIGSIDIDEAVSPKTLLLAKNYQQLTDSAATNSASVTANAPIRYNQLQDPQSLLTTFTNFRLHYTSFYSLPYQWYPNSSHILIKTTESVEIIEYDATNRLTIYAGPFSGDFIYPWPDGSKLIVTTNLNAGNDTPQNLYAVDIR
jgi:hypothetical protein